MANSLLQQAMENTALMLEIADAVTSADSSVNLEDVDDRLDAIVKLLEERAEV